MAIDIENQIGLINKSLEWIRKYHPEHYDTRFLQLVECRKVLKTMLAAKENNPGIAVFGAPMVGKSYLIGCLLQNREKPFMVTDKYGQEYDFCKSINPMNAEGGGIESTGVICRFTSFKRNPKRYHNEYPIGVKLCSLADIILILSEVYYNILPDYVLPTLDDVENFCIHLREIYAQKEPVNLPLITADDILRMKDYFVCHINNAQVFNNARVAFFDRLALIIENVPPTEYLSIFSFIWNNDSSINRLYNKLYDTLKLLKFAHYIYLPIEAVLHYSIPENTIMSAQCLRRLFADDAKYVTDVYLKENGQFIKCATNISKSQICAVCSEVVFKIEEEFLSSTDKYAFECIDEDVKLQLNQNEIQMTIFRDNDLLDFPSMKYSLYETTETIKKYDEILSHCFLRGKVSCLFNKYNDEMGINILLYCHYNKMNAVTDMYRLLESWIKNYVGATPEERRKKLAITQVSPLFYIGTMFNLDMAQNDWIPSTETAINARWNNRFDILNKDCFNSRCVEWVHNWTKKGENFQNCYLLRDYKYSGPKYGMYKGFQKTHRETEMIMSKEYYDLMRKTFIQNQYVKQFFANPALSWDVVASMNNDGSLYIKENLAIVAGRMDKARETQFAETSYKMINRVKNIMKEYFISDDVNARLADCIRKVNSIFQELELIYQSQMEYTHLLHVLQLTEAESFKKLH